jgi:hypothetical protein
VSGQPRPPKDIIPPHVLECEESFLASLGWGLQENELNAGKRLPMLSAALGLDPAAFVYPHCATIFRAILDAYLTDVAFTWIGVRKRLWDSGWIIAQPHNGIVITDVMLNCLTTIGGMPYYQAQIEQHRKEIEQDRKENPGGSSRGYE